MVVCGRYDKDFWWVGLDASHQTEQIHTVMNLFKTYPQLICGYIGIGKDGAHDKGWFILCSKCYIKNGYQW